MPILFCFLKHALKDKGLCPREQHPGTLFTYISWRLMTWKKKIPNLIRMTVCSDEDDISWWVKDTSKFNQKEECERPKQILKIWGEDFHQLLTQNFLTWTFQVENNTSGGMGTQVIFRRLDSGVACASFKSQILCFLAIHDYRLVKLSSSVQLLSRIWLFVTPWTAACQASLSITNSWSLLKLMSIRSVMPSNHLILCCPLCLLPSIFSSIRVFSNESGGQIIGASSSVSVLPMNIQDWFPLGLTGLISLQSKRLSRVFSNTTVQKHKLSKTFFFNSFQQNY